MRLTQPFIIPDVVDNIQHERRQFANVMYNQIELCLDHWLPDDYNPDQKEREVIDMLTTDGQVNNEPLKIYPNMGKSLSPYFQHCTWKRRLDCKCFHQLKEYLTINQRRHEIDPTKTMLTMYPDYFKYRSGGQLTAWGAPHRDYAFHGGVEDIPMGGWVNLDAHIQTFSYIPDTCIPNRQREGYVRVDTKIAPSDNFRELNVPPGAMVVFPSTLIHRVARRSRTSPGIDTASMRMYTSFLLREVGDELVPDVEVNNIHSFRTFRPLPDKGTPKDTRRIQNLPQLMVSLYPRTRDGFEQQWCENNQHYNDTTPENSNIPQYFIAPAEVSTHEPTAWSITPYKDPELQKFRGVRLLERQPDVTVIWATSSESEGESGTHLTDWAAGHSGGAGAGAGTGAGNNYDNATMEDIFGPESSSSSSSDDNLPINQLVQKNKRKLVHESESPTPKRTYITIDGPIDTGSADSNEPDQDPTSDHEESMWVEDKQHNTRSNQSVEVVPAPAPAPVHVIDVVTDTEDEGNDGDIDDDE